MVYLLMIIIILSRIRWNGLFVRHARESLELILLFFLCQFKRRSQCSRVAPIPCDLNLQGCVHPVQKKGHKELRSPKFPCDLNRVACMGQRPQLNNFQDLCRDLQWTRIWHEKWANLCQLCRSGDLKQLQVLCMAYAVSLIVKLTISEDHGMLCLSCASCIAQDMCYLCYYKRSCCTHKMILSLTFFFFQCAFKWLQSSSFFSHMEQLRELS